MSLKEVIHEIRRIVNRSLLDLKYDAINFDVSEPPKSEFGDLTTNIAFLLGKKNHKKPYEIARELVYNSINIQLKNRDKDSLILNAEAHPSGHINFNINYKHFNKFIFEIVKQEKLSFTDIGINNQIFIIYTCINYIKSINIDHINT